jgi:uncharacterized protein (TIGR03437 family)
MRGFFLLTLLACLPASAQISCTLNPVKVTWIDHEKCTKAIVAQLVCTGGTPTPAGEPVPGADFEFTSNAPIANSGYMLMDLTTTVGANLAYGAGLSAVEANGLSYNGPGLTGVGGSGLNYTNAGGGAVPNFFWGVEDGTSALKFTNVPYDPGASPRTITIHFWIKACELDSSSSVSLDVTLQGQVVATAKFGVKLPAQDIHAAPAASSNSPAAYSLTPSSLDLGPDLNCFVYQAITGHAPGNQSLNAGLLGSSPAAPSAASATLNVSALFPACVEVPASGYQNVVGQFYDNDIGFTAPGFPSPFANFGTEFQAVFNNIPAGVSVFVQTNVTNALGSIILTSPGTAAGSTGLTQLPVANGSAAAIWEAQTASTTATGTFAIPVYFAWQSGVASPSHITVVQSLASPPGGVQYVQPPVNVLQPVLFSINTGASTTPKLTATVDSRPCIVGVTFWTNNACSPSNGLPVNVVSDSAEVVENQPAFTSNGGLSFFGLTGFANTPSQTQIFPNASNATPGIWVQDITISGQASNSTSSVTVPFTVTVLPPNNPVFELNAVFDAFSYQSETIAPGQIYTIFGTNFGPATLALGTLDSSGKLSTTVANTQVMFDNVPSPLLYVVNGQLSGVAPFELAGKTSTNVQIVYNNLTSPAVAVPVVPASISIASADSSGGNGGVVINNKDGTLNTVSNPASVGDTVVIYASYAGPFANGVKGTDGRTTTGPPYPAPAGTPSVSIGGVPATNIPYFGNAPGLLESVMQINVVIPAGVPSSPYNPLVISAGGVSSTGWTTIAVQ